jgi:hypothetical protein
MAALAEPPAAAAVMAVGDAPIEAAAMVVVAAASAKAVAVAVAGAAPAESAAAAAARATKVFLLRLPRGRPRLRDNGGIAAKSLTLFRLPSGRLRLRPLDPPSPPAPDPPGAPSDDMAEARASWRWERTEDDGAVKWERPLKSSEALKGKKCEKSSRLNA